MGDVKYKQALLLDLIEALWKEFPDLRLGQLLFNLDVLRFDPDDLQNNNNLLIDIYSDSDKEILDRITNSALYKDYVERKAS